VPQSDSEQKSDANIMEKWARSGKEGLPPVHAATVVLLRDGDAGLETLMLRRNSKIVFGGMWVFPGGRVDPEDWQGVEKGDDLAASRRAAEREALEECGLAVSATEMVPLSHWTPPPITPKRFLTWFFAARASEGTVAIDHGEIHDHDWMRPADALARQAAQEIEVVPPTWVTLHELTGFACVDEALTAIGQRPTERFTTCVGLSDAGPVAMWHGDAGYEAGDASLAGPRHRLTMTKTGPWLYDRSSRPET